MKISHKKILVGALMLLVSIFLLSTGSFAAGPYKPYLNYSGKFSYTDSTHTLLLNTISFGKVTYLDGSSVACLSSTDPICGTGTTILISNLYNTATDNWNFNNGSGGGVTFQIKDSTYTYLNATLQPLSVTGAGSPPGTIPAAFLNTGLTDFNLTNVSYGNAPSGYSSYLDELKSVVSTGEAMQYSISFSFTSGGTVQPKYDFKGENAAGTINGIVSAPEPLSSMLFVAGGATLIFRHYSRKKVKWFKCS